MAGVLLLASIRTYSQANGGPCGTTGNETLKTDASRYQPGQTAHVTGSGYASSCNLTMTVSGPASTSSLATTDASGNVSFSYLLGSAPGEYTVATYMGDDADPWTSSTFTNGPYIETDMPDYAPFNPVTMSGKGWQAGESITIVLEELDGPDDNRTFTAVADSEGSFSTHEFKTDDNDFGVHFRATATGQVSGYSTRVLFSDAFTATSRVAGNWNANATWSITRTGSVITSTASTTVTGVSTNFLTELSIGDVITTTGDVVLGTVAGIGSDASLTLTANATQNHTPVGNAIAWKARRAPAAADDAVIGAGATGVTVTAPASINTLTNTATSSKAVTINSGQSLNVAGAVTVTGNGTLNSIIVNGSLSAASLAIAGGGNGTSIGEVNVNTGGSVTVTGAITVAASSGPAFLDLSSGSGTVLAGSLNTSAGSPTGGRIGEVLVGTGSLTVSGNTTFGACAIVANCRFTFSGAGTANIGGNLGNGATLTNFAGSTINFNGASAGSIGTYTYQNLTVSKTGGAAATLAGNTTVNGNLTVNSGGVFAGNGALTLTLAGSVANSGTIQLDGGTGGCGGTDNLLLRSSVAGTQRSWTGAGTFTIQDVDVKDQAGTASISAISSTNSGNNGANWTITSGCVVNTTTTVALTSGTNPSAFGDALTFTASVTPGVSTGNVTFYDGGTCGTPGATLSGPAAVSGSGQASFSTSALTAASHTILACYAGVAGFNASNGSVSQTVNKATATIVVTPYSVPFDGAAHTATGTATGVGGADLSAQLTLTGTTHTNAGSYPTDPWSFAGGANYNDANGTVSDSIGKATATIVVTPYSVPFDGATHTATGTATGVGGADLSAQLTLTGTTHTDAGSYPTDTWSFAGGTNYNDANGTVADSISKVNATIVVTPYSVPYDGAAHTATGTATGVGGADLSAQLTLTGTTHTDAGTYPTDPWSFAGGTNYNDDSGTVSDAISKATATIVVTGYSVPFDGAAHTATGTATGVGGADLSAQLTLTGTTHTDAGSYPTDPWSFAGGTNYNDENGTVSDAIAKADATIAVTPYNVTYDAAAHTATGTATGVGGANLSAQLTLTGTTHTDAGSYPTDPWSFAGGANYNDANGTVNDNIDKATSTTTVTGGTFTYDTLAHAATVSVTGAGGLSLTPAPTYSGACSSAPVNVSQTPCTASYTFTGDANHTGSTGSNTIIINKAPTSTTVTAANYTYDGAPHGQSALVTGPGLSSSSAVTYTGTAFLGSVSYGPSATAPTNAGNYTASASYGGGPNYLASSGSSNYTIAKGADADGDDIPDFMDCSPLSENRVVYKTGTPLATMLQSVLPASKLHTSLQAAVTAAADNDIIGMYADTTENVIIGNTTGSGAKDLRVVGCGHKITAAVTSKPVITTEVSAGANDGNTGAGEMDIHIEDVTVLKGSIGVSMQTSKASSNNTSTLVKSLRADTNGIGVKIGATGAGNGANGNEIRGANSISSNTTDGIQAFGSGNSINGNRIMSNTQDGIELTGDSNILEANKVGEKGTGNKGNGIVVVGASNTLNENDVFASTQLGIKITGGMNLVYKNDVGEKDKGNLTGGILITGDNNLLGKALSENDVYANGGVGIAVVGNGNLLSKNDVGDEDKGNTGDGVNVLGFGNTIDQNNVFANGKKVGTTLSGDGIDVAGGTSVKPNVISNNNIGDRNKGNFGNGIVVGGTAADAANGTASPVGISGNTVRANGLNGVWVNKGGTTVTTGHQVASNVSGGSGSYASGGQDNGKCEFLSVAGNFNSGGNTSNGTTVPGAMNSAFPTTCQGTP